MGIGAPELIIVLVVVLLLFGTTRLPKLARSLGQASKEFKQGVSDSREDGDPKGTEPEAIEAIEAKDTKRPASPSSN